MQEDDSLSEAGNRLLLDLARFATQSRTPSSGEDEGEDFDMLSIVVNDALSGIDVSKKYPEFYARTLADEELRSAFLDTLELVEQSRAGELVGQPEPVSIDLSFLNRLMTRPTIRKSLQDKLIITWTRSIENLQNIFHLASLEPGTVYRSENYLNQENYINILNSQVLLGNQEIEVRLDTLQTLSEPDLLDLMLVVFVPDEFDRRFEVSVSWGAYESTAEINKYGMAKLPPLITNQVFSDSGDVTHDFELSLRELN